MEARIFLIGLMGSGKSYWGEKIAALLHYQFIDLDTFIEENEGKSIASIFEQGETHFRLLEKKYLEKVILRENIVVATGGGTPCFYDNMKKMNDAGKTYYLKAEIETIISRLQHQRESRPLLKGKSPDELPAFFLQQLKTRKPFYEQADRMLQVEKLSEKKLARMFNLE